MSPNAPIASAAIRGERSGPGRPRRKSWKRSGSQRKCALAEPTPTRSLPCRKWNASKAPNQVCMERRKQEKTMADEQNQSPHEVVGIFHTAADLQAAVDDLLSAGFDRAELSFLASAET